MRAGASQVTLGSGTVTLEASRVNDKRVVEGARQKFKSAILPPYLRRSQNVSELLPLLYLRGLSTGDFREALPTLLGENASGLSPSAITRLVATWSEERSAWKERSLADRDYVYVWADGVHFNVRLDDDRLAVRLTHCGAREVFKLLLTAEKSWRKLNGHELVPLVRAGSSSSTASVLNVTPSQALRGPPWPRVRTRRSRLTTRRSPLDQILIHNS